MTIQSKFLRNLKVGAFTLVFSLMGCQFSQDSNVKENVLVYCSEGSPQTFNPQLSTSGTTFDASSRTIYNRLVEFTPGTTEIVPSLAESWKISSDGKSYLFNLRKNVQFHSSEFFTPTRSFNADDVIFSFEKQWLKSHPFYKTSNLSYRYFLSMGLGNLIDKIERVNSHQIRFVLKRAESPFLATLAMDFASILSAEYADQLAQVGSLENIDHLPIGTGPFQLVRYQPDAYIRYKAHTDYWKGKEKLNNLVFAITPDPALRFARLVAGECDVMANPLPVHIKSTKQFENTTILSDAGLNVAYLSLNTNKAPFNNIKVRQALNYAINKNIIIKAVYKDTATIAKSPIPPNMWSYSDSIESYDYSPEKARKLLNQAGFPDGFSMTIWTMSAQRAYNPDAKKMAELIQQNLKEIGVEVEIESYEYGTFLNKVRHGEHHSALLGWISDNGDPDNFFTPLLSCAATLTGTNASFWCDKTFNQLIKDARANNQLTNRTQFYQKAQAQFVEAAPWVPIAHATQYAIINPRVKNFKIIPAGGVNFSGVYLQKAPSDD